MGLVSPRTLKTAPVTMDRARPSKANLVLEAYRFFCSFVQLIRIVLTGRMDLNPYNFEFDLT